MILSTTPVLSRPTTPIGPVFCEIVLGANLGRTLFAQWRETFGGRTDSIEKLLASGRARALKELEEQAAALRADAVLGVAVSFSPLIFGSSSLLGVFASGTAVRFEPPDPGGHR